LAKKPKKTESEQSLRLREELQEAIADIDERGLLFLLEQARILVHNAHVEHLQKEADILAAGARTEGTESAGPVRVEPSEDGETFFLVLGSTRKVLSRQELRSIARICHGAESEAEAAERIHRYLARERGDVLLDAEIRSPAHPLLTTLYHEVRSTYRPKD